MNPIGVFSDSLLCESDRELKREKPKNPKAVFPVTFNNDNWEVPKCKVSFVTDTEAWDYLHNR